MPTHSSSKGFELGLVNILIAVGIGLVIWRVSTHMIRMLATPPTEIDPEDLVMVDQPYKCTICGAEVTMTAQNPNEADAPRHCREDMTPVWRP